MAKDIIIKSEDGQTTLYPKTVSALVYDNKSGKTVEQQIKEHADGLNDLGQKTDEKISELGREIHGIQIDVPQNVSDGYLSDNGSWNSSTNLHHVVIKIDNFKGQKVTATSSGDLVQYGFLKSYSYGNTCVWSDIIGRTNGSPTNITIPDDAIYLYLYTAGSRTVPMISGLEETKGIRGEIDKLNKRVFIDKKLGAPILGDRYLDASGNWDGASTLHHVVANVSTLKGESISATSSIQYGFLQDYQTDGKCTWASGGRKNGTPNNVVIPDDANFIYLYISGTTAVPTISVTGETLSIETEIENLNESISHIIIPAVSPDLFVEKQQNVVNLYKKTRDGLYIQFPLEHRYSTFTEGSYPSFYDNWGLGRVALYKLENNSMVFVKYLFASSEAEIAIGTGPNFSGGRHHGFENIIDNNGREILFIIDNKIVGEGEIFTLKPCHCFIARQNSDLYKAMSNTQKVAVLHKEWSLREGKDLKISVNLTASIRMAFGVGYIGMMGIFRHDEGIESSPYLTDTAIKTNEIGKHYSVVDGWEDITSHPENEALITADENCNQIYLYGSQGIGFSLKTVSAKRFGDEVGMLVRTNNRAYNKIYNCVSNEKHDSGGNIEKMNIGDTINAVMELSVE